MHDAMVDMLLVLLSCVLKPDSVAVFRVQPAVAYSEQIKNVDNQLEDNHIFMGIMFVRSCEGLLDDGKIRHIIATARAFHAQGVLYALKWLPIEDDILKHACVFSPLHKATFSINGVVLLVDRFQSYLNFSTNELNTLETEFAIHQSLKLEDPLVDWGGGTREGLAPSTYPTPSAPQFRCTHAFLFLTLGKSVKLT